MPTWGAVIFGVVLSAVLGAVAIALIFRERRPSVLVAAGLSAGLGPLLWDLILRHTGGDFFVDAPGYVFPVSLEDTGSGVFATALSALVLGLGPLRAATAKQLALAALTCGVVALLVDIYLY